MKVTIVPIVIGAFGTIIKGLLKGLEDVEVGGLVLFTNPSGRAGYDTRSIFKRSLTGLNSEFSFSKTSCLTKAEEPNLSYNLPIAGGRIIGFIPSPRVLVLCEMQSVSSRIWTRVAVSISYDDNDYTTGTSIVGGLVETTQMTALLSTARILRRVLETWGDLLSLKLQWKTIS